MHRLLMLNSVLWIFAMVLPAVFSFAFAATHFPWQIVVPLLLFGCLLSSNRLLVLATMQPAKSE